MLRLAATAITLLVVGVLALVALAGGFSTPEGGEIGIVRNGGPLDDRNIRSVIPEGSGNTWTGLFSSTRYYPAASQQRIYKFDRQGDADTEPVEVPTRDGVRTRLTGTFYLETAFENTPKGTDLLQRFDTQFGTRTFSGLHPYEDGGWAAFLAAIAQPIIDSNLRAVLAEFDCRQLVSSCALVQRGVEAGRVSVEGTDNRANVDEIERRLADGLTRQLNATLGQPYFRDIRFELGPVELPGVQAAIDSAQSAFAEVSRAQAQEAQARAIARANIEKQRGYERCPACARIDSIRALPRELQALGGDSAVAITGR